MVKKKGGGDGEERTPVGVPGFDDLCQGGLISDSVNAIIGNAGAGKTTFLLQFLYHGATKCDEAGLYVSFEPEVTDLYRAGKKQGMDFEPLVKKGSISFVKFDTDMSVRDMEKKLTALVTKNDIRRICFDPINVFAMDLPKQFSLRKQIYELVSLMKKLGACSIIAGESDEEKAEGQALADEITFTKYLVDGVIELYSSGLGGSGDRAVRISKMRMTKHFRGPVGMTIGDAGMKILK